MPISQARVVTRSFLFAMFFCLAISTATFAQSTPSLSTGKAQGGQDPAWLALKEAGKVDPWKTNAQVIPNCPVARSTSPNCDPITAKLLNTSIADTVVEPSGSGTDAAGKGYTDGYMMYLCGPGSTTVALSYWIDVTHTGKHTYYDPHMGTTWDDRNVRSYMMYIATQSYAPSYTSAGEVSYYAYPNAGTATNDERDALNWEASHHSSNWRNFFYETVPAANLNASILNSHIVADINAGHPAVTALDAYYLPDWFRGYHTSHLVTIIGYDNNAGTYTYEETCGADCHTSSQPNTGHFSIKQSTLLTAIQNDRAQTGNDGALIW